MYRTDDTLELSTQHNNKKEQAMDVNELWDNLINGEYFTEEELQLVTNIEGYATDALNDAIYARYGARDWDQLQEEHA